MQKQNQLVYDSSTAPKQTAQEALGKDVAKKVVRSRLLKALDISSLRQHKLGSSSNLYIYIYIYIYGIYIQDLAMAASVFQIWSAAFFVFLAFSNMSRKLVEKFDSDDDDDDAHDRETDRETE